MFASDWLETVRQRAVEALSVRSAKKRECGAGRRAGGSRTWARPAEFLEPRLLLSANYLFNSIASLTPFPNGENPYSNLAMDVGGNLFGTTQYGGSTGNGTVFEIVHGATAITTLASFNNADGGSPLAGVTLDSSGDIFGTTQLGGTGDGSGTIFEVVHGESVITTIASFDDGAYPQSTVAIDAGGNLFGTTTQGGDNGDGSVFEVAHGASAITTVASFNGTNGLNSDAGLTLDTGGNLFGTTVRGGTSGLGTVFEIVHGTSAITSIASFDGSGGLEPQAALTIDTSGNLFGTTPYGGDGSGGGTVFEIAHGTSAIITVASFDSTNGNYPYGNLTLDTGGNLFGTASAGGDNNDGAVFEVVAGSSTITALASFNGANGATPYAGVTLDSAGNLFGTANMGGISGTGTVFEVMHGASAITAIASFVNVNGSDPYGNLTLDGNGNLFGTTLLGGISGDGSVFEIVHGATAVTTIASFNGANGVNPQAGLTIDTSGNLFGTAQGGGAGDGSGDVFEIIHGTSAISVVASFNTANGANPVAALTLDSAGNLFGTTEAGGASGDGNVFEIAHGASTITTIASFNGATGQIPQARVTFDTNGNLFGTTEAGGANNDGTVFEIVHGTSTIITLASFNDANGRSPQASMSLDSNGNLFGTTPYGGTSGYGVVFEIIHGTSSITTIASFNGVNGKYPIDGPILDSNGNLFGTTSNGGAHTVGTVFEIAAGTSSITTITNFNVVDGASQQGDLTLDSAGDLFGSTGGGGIAGGGTIFELTPTPLTLSFTLPPASATAGSIINGSDGVQVSLKYSWGNVATSDSSNVTLTLSSGNFASGMNTATMAAVNGVATFANLAIDFPGSYTLTATDGMLAPAISQPFDIYLVNAIASFGTPATGTTLDAGVALDSNGNLYGTTNFGGANNDGTVFEIVHGGTAITTLASFNSTNGAGPLATVILDSSGNLYGTTHTGGSSDLGTVFELAKGSSTITSIASFNSANGANPYGAVALDSNGNLYGTATTGGDNNDGVVFKIAQGATTITTLASFNSINGSQPEAGLVLDSSGNLYGTTTYGGAFNFGAVFEVAAGSTSITTLASFNAINGAGPEDSLALDSSGNLYGTASLYGTTDAGGDGHSGTVFEISHGGGTITPLAYFNSANGANPVAAVVLDSSGNLYGTTLFGGDNNKGTVFEIANGSSSITTLVSFNATNGANPNAALALDASGNLYGTTYGGGAGNVGAVFELTPTPPHLSFVAPPTSTVAGAALDGAGGVQVAVQYSWGNTVPSDSSTITLTLPGALFSTGVNTATVSAVNGVATFNNLAINAAGYYTVAASDGTLAGATSAPFAITSGPNSVSGRVFVDTNNNGALDSGEAGQGAVNVTLTPTGGTGGSPVTLATVFDGYYVFANVNPGTYSVGESLPSGYALTAPVGGSAAVTVSSGQAAAGATFGNVLISSVILNFNMLVALSQDYSKPGTFANGDLNGDGVVNFNDLVLLSQNYNHTLPLNDYASTIAPANIVSHSIASSATQPAVLISSSSQAPATVEKPISNRLPVPVVKPIVPAFTVTSTRVTDPPDHAKQIVTFYARNNGVGATAGTSDVPAIDATLSSPAGLFIRTHDADGSGLFNDTDFAGEHATPMASYIRVGGPGFFHAATTSGKISKYGNMKLVPKSLSERL